MGNLNEGASRQLRMRLQELECEIVKIMSQDNCLDLTPDESASIRWALSLARITKVRVDRDQISKDVFIGHSTDRYRAQLFAILTSIQTTSGIIDKNKLKFVVNNISMLVKTERLELLSLYSLSLSKSALDEATRRRPLALVLSGGGGTSYVFVGAFLAMEESGLIPSIIAGSSMGAILGAHRALKKHFLSEGLLSLIEKTSWSKIAHPYSGPSRFGIPATFRLYLRDVVGYEFERDGTFLRLCDLAIPLRVCVAGLCSTSVERPLELEKFAHLLDPTESPFEKTSKKKSKSIVSAIMDFAQKPLKAVYLGGDALTKDFDVLDAVGFSAAIPGVFQYDILRNDPRMVTLVSTLLEREGIVRILDGGFVDNLPAKEAIRAVQDGCSDGYDPFVMSFDGYTPGLNRHLLFYPLMRLVAENSKEGHKLSHLSVIFKNVLSPIHLVPTRETLRYALKHGYAEFAEHLPFIRKMVGPIPDPSWLS